MTKLPVALLVVCAASTTAFAGGKLSGRVTDINDQPVGDATVLVTGPSGLETMVTTDTTGHYVATVHAAGAYSVVFEFGKTRIEAHADIPADGTATLNTMLAIGGEVIEIRDLPKPVQDAKPKQDPLKIPPYSDQAVLGDHWAKAWLLLDVDDHGVVNRVKFLKRPGYELDAIAVAYALEMRFDPARDEHGVPSRTYIVWPLEWPSFGWLQERFGIVTRLPTFLDSAQVAHGVITNYWPPCAGGRPLNFSADVHLPHHAALRDCSEPDFAKADAVEPWIVRDSAVPPPAVAAAPTLDPVQVRDEQITAARRFHASAIVATATTGVLAVGAAVAYTQWHKFADRADAAPDAVRRGADRDRANHWQAGTTAFVAGAVVTSMVSAYFWSRASTSLTLQPDGKAASLAYTGKF